jgi:hypothetical protein
VVPFAANNITGEIMELWNFPAVFYGCVTWSLTLRDECRLRIFGNRVLSRIFGPKRDEVTGGVEKPT